MNELKKIFPEAYEIVYCSYNILNEMDIKNKDIISADADATNMSVGIEFSNKDIPKEIKKAGYSDISGFRDNSFTLNVKAKGKFIFFEFAKIVNDE